jgi:hypothetical protein
LRLPGDLDREGLEHYRLEAERMLVRLTEEAEAWAESGTRKESEVPLRRQARHRKPLRIDQTHSTIAAPHFSIRKARRGASHAAVNNTRSSQLQE